MPFFATHLAALPLLGLLLFLMFKLGYHTGSTKALKSTTTKKSTEPQLKGSKGIDLSEYERGVEDGKVIERWESELGLSVTKSGAVKDKKTGRFVQVSSKPTELENEEETVKKSERSA